MKTKSKYKGLFGLIILACIVILLVLVMENVKVKSITVEGGEHYTAEEIKERILNDAFDRYTPFITLKEKLGFKHETIPFVEKVEIEVVDKNTVRLVVHDKVISGCVEHMGNNMYFDREGIVVESTNEKYDRVPVVTGVEFTSVVLNKRLEVENASIFSGIMELTQLFEKYGLEVDEINYDILGNVTLYVDGSIIQMGKTDNYDYRVNGLKNILEQTGETKYKLDMRNYGPENTDVSGIPINN